MAYGPGGTQTQRNPYMYQMYGGNQQQFAPGGAGQFGTMGQPNMGGYSNFMSSPLGQKFGMLMSPYRPAMNPAYGMQSYGQPAMGGEGAGSFQEAAQAASGVDASAAAMPAPQAPTRQQPDFLIPMSNLYQDGQYHYQRPAPELEDAYSVTSMGAMGALANPYAPRSRGNVSGAGVRLMGEPEGFTGMTIAQRKQALAGGGFLYDPITKTVYSPEQAKARFNYG
jgi:hypothetical protein